MNKIFCIPYLGGAASAFAGLTEASRDDIEIVALEYAGHGRRRNESFYTDFTAMVEDIAGQINEKLHEEEAYGILGYSMGALVAYEVLIQGQLISDPRVSFFAAQTPPHLFAPFLVRSSMDDEEFVAQVVANGWVGESIWTKRRFWPLLLKTLREDLRIRETYQPSVMPHRFEFDLSILYNRQDIDQERISQWEEYTDRQCNFTEIGSTHMFLHTHPLEIVQQIHSYFPY